MQAGEDHARERTTAANPLIGRPARVTIVMSIVRNETYRKRNRQTGASGERRLGVHTSIAGGVHLSIERAKELGCNTAQIFSHNPRAWFVGTIPEDSVSLFKELRTAYDIDPVFIHTSYLINLASVREDILERSIDLLIREMDLADLLGAEHVVLHTGSASQDTEEAARRRAVDALKRVSEEKAWKAHLLLENTAGEQGDISSSIEDLAEIIDGTGTPLIGGICLDTCHAFQAGYEVTTTEGLTRLVEGIETHLGRERVRLIHLNDSKRAFHSRVDRHEHIGTGSIGKEGLKRLVNHPAFVDIPLVLETPKKSDEDDIRNLSVVRRLLR